MDKFILHQSTTSEIKSLLSEVLKEELSTFFTKDKKSDNRLLTSKEVAGLLNITLPTLLKYRNEGIIKSYRIGNSVRYKMEDAQQALQNIKCIKYLRR